MKALIFLFLLTSNATIAQTSDKDEVEKIIKLYLTVTDYKDSSAISKSFHPAAKLMSVTKNGELKQMTQTEWWQRLSRITKPVIRKSKITILDISGVAAAVKVEFETSTDQISLLKINGEWRVVNKILSVVL